METAVFEPKQKEAPRSRKSRIIFAVVAVLFAGALGGAGWWWFWGSKPQVVLTVPLPAVEGGLRDVECWPTSGGGIAVLGGGKLTLIDLDGRKEVWSVPLPDAVKMDREWQEAVSMRFLSLQKWAAELTTRRSALKGDAAVKAFNIEAAKYAAELAVARSDAARPSARAQAIFVEKGVVKTVPHVFGGDRAGVDQFKSVVLEEDTIRRARIAKRGEQIGKLRATLGELRTKAQTRIKQQQLRDAEARLQVLEQEQKTDEAALARKPEVAPEPQEKEVGFDFAYSAGGHSMFTEMGGRFFLSEGSRVLGFERSSGIVKINLNLPGPILRVEQGAGALYFVAYAGRAVRYLVKLGADGSTQATYMPVAEERALFQIEESRRIPDISAMRTDYVGGESLGIAEVRLVKQEIEERQALKPGAEKAAEQAVENSVGGGVGGALAILKVTQQDAIRETTGGVERIDASTYSVSIRRPFQPNKPVWSGQFKGRVQCFSTPRLSLITAGARLVALDATNAKAWEAVLGAPVVLGDAFERNAARFEPCFELGERLYFYDRAMLTAFNIASGEVLWRIPSVGIRKIEVGGDGSLYVHSANLLAESLAYLSELNTTTEPVLMKVDAVSGAILWVAEKYEDVWASGKDLYSIRTGRHGSDFEAEVFNPSATPQVRTKIYKLNPATGKPRWEWFQPQYPLNVVPLGKTVGVLYGDSFQVIHSTAL